jgi:hypothetical protein
LTTRRSRLEVVVAQQEEEVEALLLLHLEEE